MSTGSIQSVTSTGKRYKEHNALAKRFVNKSGGDLVQGQEVIISGNYQVDKRDAGGEHPIGTVSVGGANDADVTIIVDFESIVIGKAIGGNLAAGAAVVPNGNVSTEGYIEYTAAGVSEWVKGIVLKGANQNEVIEVGILRSPYMTPAA